MKVVSNTTPIISLASIEQLSLLTDLFGKVYIPQAVYAILHLAKEKQLIKNLKPLLDEMIKKDAGIVKLFIRCF